MTNTSSVDSRLRARGWRGIRRDRAASAAIRPTSAHIGQIDRLREHDARVREHTLDMSIATRCLRGCRPGSEQLARWAYRTQELRACSPVRAMTVWAVIIDALADTIVWRCAASIDALADMAEGLSQAGLRVLWRRRPSSSGLRRTRGRTEVQTIAETDVSAAQAETHITWALDTVASHDWSALSWAEKRAAELAEERASVVGRTRGRDSMPHAERAALLRRADELGSQASLLRAYAETGSIPHHRSAAYRALRCAIVGGDSRH